MSPFDRYPGGGRKPFGRRRGDTARQGYGLQLRRETGERSCAYCGLDLFSDYDRWLTLQVDHVVPLNVAADLGVPLDLYEDMFNLVLACAACNGFDNRYRYRVGLSPQATWTVEAFVALRDTVFTERCKRIEVRRAAERAFFDKLPEVLCCPSPAVGVTEADGPVQDRSVPGIR